MLLRVRPRLALAALAALVASTVVAGCSGDGDEPSPAPSSSPASGEPTASNTPVQRGDDGLPVDFPRDDVPVVTGQVLSANEPTKDSGAFTVLIALPGTSAEEAKQQALALLTDAGWELKGGSGAAATDAQLLTMGAGQVIVLVGDQRGETAVTYSVKSGS